MAKRGPKGISPDQKKARGETRPSQKVEVLFKDHAARPDPENLPPPSWLNARAKKIWREKTERYRQRNQKIAGFEDALAQYVALEAELIDLYKKKMTPPMAMINAHRIWASEFYDTPAAQRVPAGGGGGGNDNPFGRNGKPPTK